MVYFPFRIWKALLSTSFTYLFMLLDLRYSQFSSTSTLNKNKSKGHRWRLFDNMTSTIILNLRISNFFRSLNFQLCESILPNSQVRSFLRCRISFHRMTLMVNNHCRIFYSIKISNEDVDWYIYIYINAIAKKKKWKGRPNWLGYYLISWYIAILILVKHFERLFKLLLRISLLVNS